MYYYTFKATSKDGKEVREYLYNEAVDNRFSKEVMMTFVKDFIKRDLAKDGLDMKDFTFTRKLDSYKNFRSRYEDFKFINNRKPAEIEPVPEDMKQSDEAREKNSKKAKQYHGARLPKNPYGTWAKDPLYKY